MKRILVQAPEGMRKKILELADKFEGEVFIDGEARFGACDLAIHEAKALQVDKIVHFGHTKFMNVDFPVEYIEVKEKYNPTKILRRDMKKLGEFRTIGLASALQYNESLKIAKKVLEKQGKIVKLGKKIEGGRNFHASQILGCDLTSVKPLEKEIDCFLFIGTGIFHPLGLTLDTEKPVFVLSVEKDEIIDMNNLRKRYTKQKYAAIGLARHAKRFGILISVKPGQIATKLAESIKKRLEEKGKKAYILVFNEIKPEKLEGLDLDCYINTACPRVSVDDRTNYKKPIIGVDEIDDIFK